MTSSLERRLDKLVPKLPTFEEWLGQLGQGGWAEMYSAEAKSAFEKGPPYPWREGTEEAYPKKLHERLVAIMAARKGRGGPISPLSEDPEFGQADELH
jgi:hypothetical protein